EIGHALADHTRERMSIAMTVGVGTALLAAVATSRSSDPYSGQRAQGVESAAAMAAALAITLPNSREGETEADQIGIELAARAGFDPQAAVTLWEKMAKESGKEGGTPSEFFSTHPSPENRAERLRMLTAKVEPLYRQAKNNKSAG